jgi:hypothetical protein
LNESPITTSNFNSGAPLFSLAFFGAAVRA